MGVDHECRFRNITAVELRHDLLLLTCTHQLLDAIDASRNTSIVWGSAIFLVVILSLYMTTRLGIIRPLTDLTQVADQFRSGNRTTRAQVRRNDELGRLGNTFNAMADEIVGFVAGLAHYLSMLYWLLLIPYRWHGIPLGPALGWIALSAGIGAITCCRWPGRR